MNLRAAAAQCNLHPSHGSRNTVGGPSVLWLRSLGPKQEHALLVVFGDSPEEDDRFGE